MRNWAVTGAAAVLVASLTPALAVDNSPTQGGSTNCECLCSTGGLLSTMFYPSDGQSCRAYWNRTCNAENPATGLIETGTIMLCMTPGSTSAGPVATPGLSNPGSPQGGIPSLQLPLTGGMRQ